MKCKRTNKIDLKTYKTTKSIFFILPKNFFSSTDCINNKSKDITLPLITMFHC